MTLSSSNMIANPELRTKRKEEKQYLVLRFLREVLWSTQDILQMVMNLQSRQAAHKSLAQMERMGLIKAHTFSALGGKLKLWGITASGQTMAFDVETEAPYGAYFEPTRISEQLIRHQLDLQKIRIKAESLGWKHWQDGNRLGLLNKNTKRPDAIVINANGFKVAIECERTFKTQKRYEQILLSYLLLIKSNKVNKVVWISPTREMARRLEVLIKSIKKLKVAGQVVQVEPEKHHRNLHFCSYQDWPNYE